MEQGRRMRQILSVLPLFFLAFMGYVRYFLPERYYYWLIREDGPLENAEALAYFFTALIAFAMASRFKKNGEKLHSALYIIFSVCLLFICLEEISWGQRIFGIQSPRVMLDYNYQQEINLHNLLPGYGLHLFFIIVGFYGSFAALLAPKRIGKVSARDTGFYVPGQYLFFYFFICFLFYFYHDYLGPLEKFIYGDKSLFAKGLSKGYKEEEVGEFLLSTGFFLFTSMNALEIVKSKLLCQTDSALMNFPFIGTKRPVLQKIK